MLLLVTVFAAFLAYHVNWISQRHEVLVQNQCDSASIAKARADQSALLARLGATPLAPDPVPNAPGMLWLFGEQGQYKVTLQFKSNVVYAPDNLGDGEEEVVDRVKRLFPEAIVKWVHPGNHTIVNRRLH